MRQWLTVLQIACAGVLALASAPASAASMTGDELRAFLVGRTYYLEVSAGGSLAQSGTATLYFAPDGTILNRVPSGRIQQGVWRIDRDMVCVTWKDQPPNPCSRYVRQGDTVTVINVETGLARGRISKTGDGNAEALAP